ncbi:MAG TPA: SRPBCC family protein [Labilithrix sp.]
MSFVTEATSVAEAPPEAVFDRLSDFASWRDWMPRAFRPIGKEPASLARGAKMRVSIAHGPPSKLEVTAHDRPREIAWRGGVAALLGAEHRFLFESLDDGKRTRIRSVETWRGALTPFLRPIVKRLAERIGKQQVDALARIAERS